MIGGNRNALLATSHILEETFLHGVNSKKQNVITGSCAKVEYHAMAMNTCKMMRIWFLL